MRLPRRSTTDPRARRSKRQRARGNARRNRSHLPRTSMTPVNRVLMLALAGLVLHLPVARAQNPGAEALFREGRELIKKGNLKAGCEKLEASEKLESSVGTLLNL